MKNNAIVPSLSTDGWVDTPVKSADYLFSHLFLSDYSQSYLYHGNVSSISYLLYKNQSSINNLINDLKNTIEQYFSLYYDSVNCSVVDSSGDSVTGSLAIYLELIDNGNTYTLNKILEYTDSKIRKVLEAL